MRMRKCKGSPKWLNQGSERGCNSWRGYAFVLNISVKVPMVHQVYKSIFQDTFKHQSLRCHGSIPIWVMSLTFCMYFISFCISLCFLLLFFSETFFYPIFSSSMFSPIFPYVLTSKFSVFSYVFFSMFLLLLCFLLNNLISLSIKIYVLCFQFLELLHILMRIISGFECDDHMISSISTC